MSLDPGENEVINTARGMVNDTIVTSDLPDYTLDYMNTSGNFASGKMTKYGIETKDVRIFGIAVSLTVLSLFVIILVIWGIVWFFMWLGWFLAWGDCKHNWFN